MERITIEQVKTLKKGDVFLWQSRIDDRFEIHTFHSDSGYGAKTFTDYNKDDGSSVIISYSGVCGIISVSGQEELTLNEKSSYFCLQKQHRENLKLIRKVQGQRRDLRVALDKIYRDVFDMSRITKKGFREIFHKHSPKEI